MYLITLYKLQRYRFYLEQATKTTKIVSSYFFDGYLVDAVLLISKASLGNSLYGVKPYYDWCLLLTNFVWCITMHQ